MLKGPWSSKTLATKEAGAIEKKRSLFILLEKTKESELKGALPNVAPNVVPKYQEKNTHSNVYNYN